MNLKTITAIAVAAVLTGCASIDDAANARQALIQKVQDTTPECTTEPQLAASSSSGVNLRLLVGIARP